jgi:DNA protecting protein DprA
MTDPDGSDAGVDPPDVAFAVALSALGDMTPARLRLLLDGRSAREVFEQVVSGDPGLVELLAPLGVAAADSPGQPLDTEVNWGTSGTLGAMERARAQARDSLRAWRVAAARIPVAQRWAELEARGIGVVRRSAADYPRRLLRARQIPEVLYVRGRLDHVSAPCVGIVGTRRATHYGLEVAAEIGRGLASCGVVVVSGLARGIDAAAHRGALAACTHANGPLGVVGGGVDVVYPRENRRLWDEVVAAGGLVSEAPPGAPPESWRFPLRNRIIAALSQVLVVVESSRQGGAMHTVLAADAYGVPILAVPGSVRSPQSEGTNAIIQEGGAGVVLDVHDVLAVLELECLQDGTPASFSLPRPGDDHPRPVSTSWRTAGGRQRERGKPGTQRSAGAGSGLRGAGSSSSPRLRGAGAGTTQQAMDFVFGGTGERQLAEARRQRAAASCSPTERAVLEAVDYTTTLLDLVCLRTNLDLGCVALAIDRLDELGLVRTAGAGWIRL